MSRRAGLVGLRVDGTTLDVKGSVTINSGYNTREGMVGHDSVHGFKELPTVPSIELEITDRNDLDLDWLASLTDATVVATLANGKIFMLSNAWSVNADGLTYGTEDANINVKFEGKSGQYINS